jgi:hypothetical protein
MDYPMRTFAWCPAAEQWHVSSSYDERAPIIGCALHGGQRCADFLLQVPLELYKSSMKGVRKYLVRHVWDGHEESSIVSEARADPNSGSIGETSNRFEHLTCFAGGMFVLGESAAGQPWKGVHASDCNGGRQLLPEAGSAACLVSG